jgi:bifunctional non-homologous end joining protein LigD
MPLASVPPPPPLQALEPMEPVLGTRPFTNAAWAFQLPLNGYRMLAQARAEASRLCSRHHVDTTRWFPEVTAALQDLRLAHTMFDGEICVLDRAGRNDVQRLHDRALWPGERPGHSRVVYCINDVLVHQGVDQRPLPWLMRRRLLRALLREAPEALRLQPAIDGSGEWLYEQALALDRPAIVAWRREAPYQGGRSNDCLSIPCRAAHRTASA